ncbi:hypothetical protein ACFY7C_00580 [Streptomyces sp. NPDC012769]|uniref:hypothetical protein n=1 Tax=Streptomyces sp. NPDC012769 TaxID=3364848 RepID=UPI0036BB8AA2
MLITLRREGRWLARECREGQSGPHHEKRGSRGARPLCFDPVDYRERHAVERGINDWL